MYIHEKRGFLTLFLKTYISITENMERCKMFFHFYLSRQDRASISAFAVASGSSMGFCVS